MTVEATFLPGKCARLPPASEPGRGDLRARGRARAVGRATSGGLLRPGDAVVIPPASSTRRSTSATSRRGSSPILSPVRRRARATRSRSSPARSRGRRCEAGADAGGPDPRGRRGALRGGARPGRGHGRGRRRAPRRGAEPARHPRPQPARRLRTTSRSRSSPGTTAPAFGATRARRSSSIPASDWGPSDDRPGALQWLGGPLDGTFAELIAVPEENVFPKPARLSWEEAASLPVAGMTAYRALHPVGRLAAGRDGARARRGQRRRRRSPWPSPRRRARACSSRRRATEKIERSRELGADGGVLYTEGDWAAAVRELAPGRRRPRRRLGRHDVARLAARAARAAVGSSSSAAPAARRSSSTCATCTSTTSRSSARRARRRAQFGDFLEAVQAGSWQPGDRQRPPARRGGGGLRAAGRPTTTARSCWRISS